MRRSAVGVVLLTASAGLGLADDHQTCLNSDVQPIAGLIACTRIISSVTFDGKQAANTYYHRGLGFMELGEWEHARIDFERSIELDTTSKAAAGKLRELEHDGRIAPRR